VAVLAGMLQDVVLNYRVPFEKFSHVDFVFAIDADKYVYSKVLEVMKKY
jgi:lysosomal acid lipase/cholesteryl ester hydrolase